MTYVNDDALRELLEVNAKLLRERDEARDAVAELLREYTSPCDHDGVWCKRHQSRVYHGEDCCHDGIGPEDRARFQRIAEGETK